MIMEENQQAPAAEPVVEQKIKRRSIIPTKEIALLALSNSVQPKWAITKMFLEYATPDDLAALNQELELAISAKGTSSRQRNPIAIELKEMDQQLEIVITIYKALMIAHFRSKRLAAQRFTEFSIVKNSGRFSLPTDRTARIAAIPVFMSAIEQYGITHSQYDLTWWADFQTKYTDLIAQTKDTVIDISNKVGNKTELKQQVSKILRSITKLIEAHFPDTYQRKLRDYGFLREMY